MARSQWSSDARWGGVIVKGVLVWSCRDGGALFSCGAHSQFSDCSADRSAVCRHTSYTLGLLWWSAVEEASDLSLRVVAMTLKSGVCVDRCNLA